MSKSERRTRTVKGLRNREVERSSLRLRRRGRVLQPVELKKRETGDWVVGTEPDQYGGKGKG